jgi:hypothetical protein
MNAQQAKMMRKVARQEIRPIAAKARVDVAAVQNDMVVQLCQLPFLRRLRFCFGIMVGI